MLSEQGAPVPDRNEGLADAMRRHTRPYHVLAEKSGVMHSVLNGHASREAYALFLRNLLPVYQQLERALEQYRHHECIARIAQPAVYRTASIMSDMDRLSGPGWVDQLPVLSAAKAYADRIDFIAQKDVVRLIAHAYTRYLGDLNGGQILHRLLTKTLQLEPEALLFYHYPGIDPAQFKSTYREMIDKTAHDVAVVSSILDEAVIAFQLNIELSVAVERSAG